MDKIVHPNRGQEFFQVSAVENQDIFLPRTFLAHRITISVHYIWTSDVFSLKMIHLFFVPAVDFDD